MRTIVICIEGCHGSGKTSIIKGLNLRGYQTMDEAFVNQETYGLHPQSFIMETTWVVDWFKNILKLHHTSSDSCIYIADRSPYSAVLYAKNKTGRWLNPVIQTQIDEVKQLGIDIYTLYIKVSETNLWSRILERLKKEPARIQYNENSREWMKTVVDFYDNQRWNYTVSNDDGLNQTVEKIEQIIKGL